MALNVVTVDSVGLEDAATYYNTGSKKKENSKTKKIKRRRGKIVERSPARSRWLLPLTPPQGMLGKKVPPSSQ